MSRVEGVANALPATVEDEAKMSISHDIEAGKAGQTAGLPVHSRALQKAPLLPHSLVKRTMGRAGQPFQRARRFPHGSPELQ